MLLLLSIIVNVLIPYALATSTYCGTTDFPSPRDLYTVYAQEKNCCVKDETTPATTLHSIWSLESDTMTFGVDRSNTQTLKVHSTAAPNHPYTLSINGVQYCYDGSIDFRWGEDLKGSEHKLNHQQYAMEAHYIHYKCHLNSVTEALDYWVNEAFEDPDETPVLAIVAVFFQISESKRNPGFDKILNGFDHHSNFDMNLFEDGLIPKEDIGFLNYHGSTTTSKCYPVVNWIIADSPSNLIIHKEQLAELRMSTTITSNWQPIQHSDQKVFLSCCLSSDPSNNDMVRRRLSAECDDGDGNGNLPDQDELTQFISSLEDVCCDVEGLIDNDVFQSAVSQMLTSLPDLHSATGVFDKAFQFHMATMAAWQGLRQNCIAELTTVNEELGHQETGKQKILDDTKRRAHLERQNQIAKLKLLIPHMQKLQYTQPNNDDVDCVDCEQSDNEALSYVANSLNKLQHLGRQQTKARNAIFGAVFTSSNTGPNINEMLGIINEKIGALSRQSSLFSQCITLATDKIEELEGDADYKQIQKDMMEIDARTSNETEGLVEETIQTFFELAMGKLDDP